MMPTNWRELFQGIYRRRSLTIWTMWFCSYLVANGMITWMPTLYHRTLTVTRSKWG
jgi:putative MFS transporter